MKKPVSGYIVFAFSTILCISVLVGFMVMAQDRSDENSSMEQDQNMPEADMTFKLTSDAFTNGQSIPVKYSCIGKNISPALAWTEPPAGTQSFAFIVDDPDAPMGTWVHWVLFNIPADLRNLAEGFSADNPIVVGKNSSSQTSYQGPCPPSGTHRYYFKLYALDEVSSLSPGATKDQLLKAMDGHILAQTELMGTFSK